MQKHKINLPMVFNKLSSFYIRKQIKASIGTELQ